MSTQTVERELAKEEKKTKLGFNGLTPSEWALLSKNVITEDDILNPFGTISLHPGTNIN